MYNSILLDSVVIDVFQYLYFLCINYFCHLSCWIEANDVEISFKQGHFPNAPHLNILSCLILNFEISGFVFEMELMY